MSRVDKTIITGNPGSATALDQVSNGLNTRQDTKRHLLSPETVCPLSSSVALLPKFTNFSLIGITTSPQEIVIECTHQYDFITVNDLAAKRLTPIPGTARRRIVLDRAHDNIPVRDEMVVTLKDGSSFKSTARRTIKTLTNTKYEDDWEFIQDRISQVDRVGQTNSGSRKVVLGEVPLKTFYLSTYGLPEPEGLDVPDFDSAKRLRRYAFAGVAALAAIGVALFIRFRRRRAGGGQ